MKNNCIIGENKEKFKDAPQNFVQAYLFDLDDALDMIYRWNVPLVATSIKENKKFQNCANIDDYEESHEYLESKKLVLEAIENFKEHFKQFEKQCNAKLTIKK